MRFQPHLFKNKWYFFKFCQKKQPLNSRSIALHIFILECQITHSYRTQMIQQQRQMPRERTMTKTNTRPQGKWRGSVAESCQYRSQVRYQHTAWFSSSLEKRSNGYSFLFSMKIKIILLTFNQYFYIFIHMFSTLYSTCISLLYSSMSDDCPTQIIFQNIFIQQIFAM